MLYYLFAKYYQENQKKLFKDIVQFDANDLQEGNGSGIGLWSELPITALVL